MKNKLLRSGLALLAGLMMQGTAFAQMYPPIPPNPMNPDIFWYRDSLYIAGINTAMIDYYDTIDHLPGKGSLIVSDYYGNGMVGGVVFKDLGSGFMQQIKYNLIFPGPFYITKPDIIVGNDAVHPLTDFRVAAAYSNSGGMIVQPQIDYFLVHYTGPGVFIVTYTGSTFFTGFGAAGSYNVHIDIVAEAGNTAMTGLPWCDKFIVTWDSYVPGMPPASTVYAYQSSLNAPVAAITPFSPFLVQISPAGYQPDVAAIQRQQPYCPTCPPTPIDIVGLFTYTDPTGTNLMYAEYDFSTMTFFTPPVLQYINFAGITQPRIDAPDDYNINWPTPFFSYYKVAAEVGPWPGVSSITSDNQVPGGVNDATYYMPGDIPFSPTVAFGGNNNTQYQVSHYINEYAALGGVPNVYMEPIDWIAFGTIPAFSPPPVTQPYFQVNTTPILPNFVNGNYLNAISTPCNKPADLTLCAWSFFLVNPFTHCSEVYYKTSTYNPTPGSNGYAFRHTKPASVTNTIALPWQVYPNPATLSLTVNNPGTKGGRYEIIDMLGRSELQGSLQPGVQAIDISTLKPGSYIINMYQEGVRQYNSVFVKQ